ncbi:DUF5107 domain-containing protein [Haloferula sp. A504]|uniref:DUF5107 domain-containing protein n=1 Tax=Haloferula sp. A504 TaxID=3373601 RepID=UPI0031BC6F54|nr:DUF5107 domain-containing protein [Verrucomicrobiaceae bacterium E54]
MPVIARLEPRVIPTYPVGAPERNPVFFEKRVYQGSNGKVYPVPFIDKVHDDPVDITYQSALLENDYVRLVMLPEIGGRIFLGQDKTNADYDFFYRQDVIKPALVGLAGPWISGGVEFNWPQHHRPGTFMPADVHIEDEGDGAFTVWMSEHDPIHRLKGMHGIRLRPGSSRVELRARLYNRTPFVHTFLWWANVAARVHDQYQSFFPPDVHYVADHAVRAMSSFPVAENPYYGIDYQNRPGSNDLSWYKNIPVPTSYMVCQTAFDFFGGYDFSKNGGFVHVANRHIAPGKKQWTWGNDRFGYAWDRELTDANGPYVELMAGVYTDNQPDFSYLLPYETKTFSQSWWPIQNIGPVQQANERAALALSIREDRRIKLGLCVSEPFEGELLLSRNGETVALIPIDLEPGDSFENADTPFAGENAHELVAELRDTSGALLLAYRPVEVSTLARDRTVATEPAAPAEVTSNDELFLTGEHLEQYRHPTRSPEPYWEEALRRDPGDARCHTALGKRALLRGEFSQACDHFEAAVARLTSRHPNPVTGEAHYHLGLALRFLGDEHRAYAAFYKATWNYEWRSGSYYQLATLDCRRGDWTAALEHLDDSLAANRDHQKASTLKALVLGKLGSRDDAMDLLESVLATDPLDHWAQVAADFIRQAKITTPTNSRNDAQTILDLAFDFSEAGFRDEAIALLDAHHDTPVDPVAVPNPLERSPMTHYVRAWLSGQPDDLAAARAQSADHFFPSRLEEMEVLEWAVAGASSPVAHPSEMATGLEAPATSSPTFTPTYLAQEGEVEKYRNCLPHWQKPNATYAVTFRLADSLAQSVLQAYRLQKEALEHQLKAARAKQNTPLVHAFEQRLDDLYRDHIEAALDQGTGACHLRDPRVAQVVADAIRHFDGIRYDLAAWCVMPNHVHLILRPLGEHPLQDILASIKSYSAQQANQLLGRSGAFWKSESYDHIIRDSKDFWNQLAYLKRNPGVAKLGDWPWIDAKPVASEVAGPSRPVAPPSEMATGLEAPATSPDPLAAYGLGNLLFDKRRHADAISAWERALADGSSIPQVQRNLGIAIWNLHRDGERAAACYSQARKLDPDDARLVSESDQLAKKRNRPIEERLAFLEAHRELVLKRDDATVELASLLNLSGRPQEALDLLLSRRFHPWEGGEGAVLRQYTLARLLLGQQALDQGGAEEAHRQFSLAMETPDSLGEAYHPLQAKADVNYWTGRSLKALGRYEEATAAFEACASESGDFTEMAVAEHSPLSWFRGLALRELGREEEALAVFRSMLEYAGAQKNKPATIDYFATSLPNLLVFEEDLQARRDAEAELLAALAHDGLGESDAALDAIDRVTKFDRSQPEAVTLRKSLPSG